jgi:hypothetical protein
MNTENLARCYNALDYRQIWSLFIEKNQQNID